MKYLIAVFIACWTVAACSQELACPQTPFFFPTERTEPLCKEDAHCKSGEKCCLWNTNKHCLKGIDTTPKPGSCPKQPSSGGPPMCIADFAGCRFDSECSGTKKCCEDTRCGYGQCKDSVIEPKPTVTVCTKIGCGSAPDPYCRKVKEVRPNGPGCEPVCQVCADKDLPVTIEKDLACPRNKLFFPTERSEPRCQRDSNCKAGEKCCLWSSGKKHCLKGIDKTPKPGFCPGPKPGAGGPRACKMDFVGCLYDSECKGGNKCCKNEDCGYNECSKPAQELQYEAPCTEIGCGPAPGPDCQIVKFVRPNGEGCEPECAICADPRTTTKKPEICETRWVLECKPRREGKKYYDSHHQRRSRRPRCKHVRKAVCH